LTYSIPSVPEARNVKAQDEVLGRQMHESSAGGTASYNLAFSIIVFIA